MGNYIREHYHQAQRQWPRVQNVRGRYVGVELEVSHRQGYEHLLDILPDPPDESLRPATETDGSLPYGTGVEIVFPAFRYEDAQSKQGFLAQVMDTLRQARTTHGTRYGMHLNVNTVGWSVEKKQFFCALINWLPAIYLARIGGRALNDYCEQYRFSDFTDYRDAGRSAACIRANRIECRFPRSTNNHDKLALLVNFLALCERFVDVKANQKRLQTAADYNRADRVAEVFLSWLSKIKTDNAPRVLEVLRG